MSVRLGRVVVVGASSGIGEAIVRRLVADGAKVAALARRKDRLDALAGEKPGQIFAYAHDVEETDEVPALWEKIDAELGGIDALIYASGVMPEVVEGEFSYEKDRHMIAVNVLGAMAWMNRAAAAFQPKKSGTIVGISSIAGERGRRGNPGYTTSKAAMTAYLEALRNRLSRYGVNVVTAKPGFVDTAMTAGKKLPMIISAEKAAQRTLALARRGNSASGFVPRRWWLVALIIRMIPSWLFRRTNV
jgi:NAD(P)-dependent dehydrogenase (short-subunit alcohol dehydrogenase family)